MSKSKVTIAVLATSCFFLSSIVIYQFSKSNTVSQGSSCSLDQIVTEKNQNPKTIYESYHVQNTISKKSAKLQACFIAYVNRKPEKTKGYVFVDWQIDSSGNAFKAEKIGASLGDDEFYSCILDTVNSWEFPPPPSGKTAYTSYKFRFASQEEMSEEIRKRRERMKELEKKEIKIP